MKKKESETMEPKLSKERKDYLIKDFKQGFPYDLGLVVKHMKWQKLETRLSVKSKHAQQDGFVHAGVMATMADHTMGYAAFTVVPIDKRILTIEFKINYLRPAKGSKLRCLAKVIKPGRSVIPTMAEIYSFDLEDEQTLVATAMGTMAAVDIKRITK